MADRPETDASLVRRALGGDAAALDRLLRRHVRAAFLVALARLGEPAEAEDACQEAFIRAVDHLAECRDPERFAPWLLQIVRNSAHNRADHLRVRAAEPLHPRLVLTTRPADDLTLRNELRAELTRSLSRVSPVQREVVLLHDLEGMRHAEIAVQLGISETMSRRHLSDARKTLRAELADYHALEPDHD